MRFLPVLNLLHSGFEDCMEYLQDIWFVPFIEISLRIETNLVFVC